MTKRKITWTKRAVREFAASIEYIRQDSEQNAEKVKAKIIHEISLLSNDTVVHRKDPYKKENDGSFLYFEVLKHRIVYRAYKEEVFIIRIRHTSMDPKSY